MAHDLFISYTPEDKSAADTICSNLEENGIPCWIAPRDIVPGEKHAPAVIHAIDTAKIVVVVFSRHSDRSAHVMTEIERAFNQGKTIIPIRIENTEPCEEIQYFIGERQWLNAFSGSLDDHISQLAGIIRKNFTGMSAPSGPRDNTPASETGQFRAAPEEEPPQAEENERFKLIGARIISSVIDIVSGLIFGYLLYVVFGILADAFIPHATLLMTTAERPTLLYRFEVAVRNCLTFLGLIYWYAMFDLSEKRSIGKALMGLRIHGYPDKNMPMKRKIFRLLIKIVPFFFIIGGSFLIGITILENTGVVLLIIWAIPVFLTSKTRYVPDLVAGTVVCFGNKTKV